MTRAPRPAQLLLPPEYGAPTVLLPWRDVDSRLASATQYWLATVRPDGRPHAVPLDGIWLALSWYFGGSQSAVKHRNLVRNPRATLHLCDAMAPVIVEGVCAWERPPPGTAKQLAAASKAKYGYGPPPGAYREGLWKLRPTRVLAWTDLGSDATRFVFEEDTDSE